MIRRHYYYDYYVTYKVMMNGNGNQPENHTEPKTDNEEESDSSRMTVVSGV